MSSSKGCLKEYFFGFTSSSKGCLKQNFGLSCGGLGADCDLKLKGAYFWSILLGPADFYVDEAVEGVVFGGPLKDRFKSSSSSILALAGYLKSSSK